MKSIGDGRAIQNELFFRSNGVSFDASSLPLEANFATPQSLWAMRMASLTMVQSPNPRVVPGCIGSVVLSTPPKVIQFSMCLRLSLNRRTASTR